jgi:hypothetical protein
MRHFSTFHKFQLSVIRTLSKDTNVSLKQNRELILVIFMYVPCILCMVFISTNNTQYINCVILAKYNFGTLCGWNKCIETCRSDYNTNIVKIKNILCIVGWIKTNSGNCVTGSNSKLRVQTALRLDVYASWYRSGLRPALMRCKLCQFEWRFRQTFSF